MPDTITFDELIPSLSKRDDFETIKRAYEYAFNELDNILFSELSYINWENIVSNYSSKIRLDHAINIFLGSLNDSTREGLSPFMKSNVDKILIDIKIVF